MLGGMNPHEANIKLGSLLRRYYQTEGHTRAEAKRLTLITLTTSEMKALIEPIMDNFLRSLDVERQINQVGRARVRAGNTSGMSDGRSTVVRQATEMFAESKDKSFATEVATLRDVAKEPLFLGNKEWVTLGSATFKQLEQGRVFSEKMATSHEATAKKINEIQRIILKAAPKLEGDPTLDKTIDFVDLHGDEAEDLLDEMELLTA